VDIEGGLAQASELWREGHANGATLPRRDDRAQTGIAPGVDAEVALAGVVGPIERDAIDPERCGAAVDDQDGGRLVGDAKVVLSKAVVAGTDVDLRVDAAAPEHEQRRAVSGVSRQP